MTEYIKQQLEKCIFADLTNFDASTNTYHIKKYSKPRYDVGKCYLVKISKELINNKMIPLSANWNNGRAPQNEYYKIYVNQMAGKMLKVDALAFDMTTKQDLQEMFSGYFPIDYLEQLAEI